MEILGIDIGFGFTKATRGDRSLVCKSILGEATELQFQERILDQADAQEEHLQVEVDGLSYFVGELAERQSDVRYFTLDQDQFVSRFAKPLALAALARLVTDHVPVNLVTGLPIGHYRQHREAFASLLQGHHAVALTDAAGQRRERTININKVRVVPQPFGSLFHLMLNDLGEIGDKRLLQTKIGIIDVGFRTSDYTIADRMRYSERGSRTTDSGIARAFTAIAKKLRELSGVNVELYRLYDAVACGSIRIRGKEYELGALTEQVFGCLAATVANEVDRLWADDWDIDSMIITGGGGAVLASYLRPLLNGQVAAAEAGGDARFNNVLGYWKYARYLWARGTIPPSGT